MKAQIKGPGAGYTEPSLTNHNYQNQPRGNFNARHRDTQARWQRYEALKAFYCGQATSSAEFERALRRARREAHV